MPPSAPPVAPIDVLVVDDAEDMVALVATLLEGESFRVRSAGSAKEALQQATRARPELVLLDLQLPDMTGEVLFDRLRERYNDLPIVFLTANNDLRTAVEMVRRGAWDYIAKPIVVDDFIARMVELGRRVEVDREVGALRALYDPAQPADQALVGNDPLVAQLWKRIALIARTDVPVMLNGESGVGKEVFARAIHRASRREKNPFVAVNTAAIPLTLWESEFFGHKKGSFTDAKADAIGLVGQAEGGTLFLDEVGEIPLGAQSKLLRFLQEREYRPVGASKDLASNVRIVCATNRDLKKMIAENQFREDLYYRLNVVPVRIPALRERASDIPLLAQFFLDRYRKQFAVDVTGFLPSTLERMLKHNWPGNVRELENVIQQAVALATRPLIGPEALGLDGPATESDDDTGASDNGHAPASASNDGLPPLVSARNEALERFERAYLERALELGRGNITQAAELADVPRKTFWRLLRRYNIEAVRDGVVSKPGRPRRAKAG